MADLSIGERILRETTSQDLSAGVLNYTTGFNFDVEILYAHFRFTIAVTQTITITFDSASGSNYDAVVISEKTSSETDYIFRPTGYGLIGAADNLKFECTNSGTPAATVYLEIISVQR